MMHDVRELCRKAILPSTEGVSTRALKAVLNMIASRSAGRGECTATLKKLAQDTGFSVRTIKRAISVLQSWNLIVTEKFRQGRSDRRRRYVNRAVVELFTKSIEESRRLVENCCQRAKSTPVKSNFTGTDVQNSEGQESPSHGGKCSPQRKEKENYKKTNPHTPRSPKHQQLDSLTDGLVAGSFQDLEKGVEIIKQLIDSGELKSEDGINALAIWHHIGVESMRTDGFAIKHPVKTFQKWFKDSNWSKASPRSHMEAKQAMSRIAECSYAELEDRFGEILESMNRQKLLAIIQGDSVLESQFEIAGEVIKRCEAPRRMLLKKLEGLSKAGDSGPDLGLRAYCE